MKKLLTLITVSATLLVGCTTDSSQDNPSMNQPQEPSLDQSDLFPTE